MRGKEKKIEIERKEKEIMREWKRKLQKKRNNKRRKRRRDRGRKRRRERQRKKKEEREIEEGCVQTHRDREMYLLLDVYIQYIDTQIEI